MDIITRVSRQEIIRVNRPKFILFAKRLSVQIRLLLIVELEHDREILRTYLNKLKLEGEDRVSKRGARIAAKISEYTIKISIYRTTLPFAN